MMTGREEHLAIKTLFVVNLLDSKLTQVYVEYDWSTVCAR